jgi:hypothetical protein
MRMSKRSLLVAVSAGCLTAGLGAGAAYAYFTASGNGAGGASVGSMKTVTLQDATAAPSTALLPGATGDVTLQVTNPNDFPVTLTRVDRHGTITADKSGCTTTGVTFANQDALSTPIAGGDTISVDLTGAVSMSAASSPGCQGAKFSIPVTITAQK